ncbi:MAG: C25 family cysteine peptidase [Thermodesulfovibrionales bacterium]|nr:C25 family cysteine peptidase [Thermodesulfovibrionales bacterium]
MHLKNISKKLGEQAPVQILFLLFALLAFISPAFAGFNDCATDWNNFTNDPGFIADYTYKGQAIKDHEATGSGDPSHGQANVPPEETDLASAATSSINPGMETTPYFGYYNGGTPYVPLDPSSMEDDYIFFRMRISGSPEKNGNNFNQYHWNILLDVDADGYKEYWIDLEGSYATKDYDRLNILYDNRNDQTLDPDAPGVRVNYFTAEYTPTISNPDPLCVSALSSHTRGLPVTALDPADTSGDYYIEIQVPMTAFVDSYGNQLLYPDSPVAFVYSTGTSNQDPLQKDWMMDLNWISNADPITFGDIIIPQGTPIIEFANSAFNFVSIYTTPDTNSSPDPDHIFLYVSDRFANVNSGLIDYIQVTVTNPNTGDDEVIPLRETGPSTGIFTTYSGYCSIAITTSCTSDGGCPSGQTCILGLPTTLSVGTPNDSDNSGSLEVVSKDTLYVSYTNTNAYTVTDSAVVLDTCDVLIEFTRANGLPADYFILTNNVNTSDKLYVTITDFAANTNPNTVQTISVNLSGGTGGDTQTLTLTETGNNTGVFRNTTGLNTQIAVLPIVANDGLWESSDGGSVTGTYTKACGGTETTTSSLFSTSLGGRVDFTNVTGTQDIELYGPGQSVYVKIVDTNYSSACMSPPNSVIISSSVDSETITIASISSSVYMNTGDSLQILTGESASTDGDHILYAKNGDTLTVTYRDCNDGDNDSTNNYKTDIATYNAPSLVINEAYFYPLFGGELEISCPLEYVQLYNSTPFTVNVNEYTISDGDSFTYTIPLLNGSQEINLLPGERIYISLFDFSLFTVVPVDRYDGANNAYYLFADVRRKYCSNDQNIPCSLDSNCGGTNTCISSPSIEFADPLDAEPSDQILLFDGNGKLIDYVGWSSTLNPNIDFLGDDSPAVTAKVWQDDAFVNVGVIAPGQALIRSTSGYDSNTPGDWTYAAAAESCELIITRVVVSSFSGHTENGKVVVEWDTDSETGTVGFYLYRKDEITGDYLQLNQKLIPGILTSRRGGEYRFIDESAIPGLVYTYLLTEIESSGKRHTYGPYHVNTNEQKTASADPVFTKTGYSRKAHEISPSKKIRLTAALQKQAFGSRPPSESPQPVPSDPAPPPVTAGTKTKVTTGEKGLYYIDSATLFSFLGTDIAKLYGSTQLKITTGGQEVPYLIADDKSGIYFYGQELNNVYTDKNVYWLEKRTGTQMPIISGTGPVPAADNKTFFDTIHYEEDWWAATGLFTDPDSDYWLWDYVFADDPVFGTVNFPTEVRDIASSAQEATLTVNLFGATLTDHHVLVSINGTPVGESIWYGTKSHTFTVSFSHSYLTEGNNNISVTGILDTGVPYSVFLVDSFDMGYHRFYKAVNDKLFLRGDNNPVVTVSGFSGPEIMVVDTANPRAPKLVKAATIDTTDDATYRISFVPSSPNTNYLAIHRNAMSAPISIVTDTASQLTRPLTYIDYLIITPKELKEGALSLSEYRKSRGLKPMVVELEDIMDEFNYGIYSPEAIKRFLATAFSVSSRFQKSRAVVLVGHGTEDYKDIQGFAENLLPPIMIGTVDGIAPSDTYYADTNGDHIPEMAIGRLPVITPQELQLLIEKIKAYESSFGSWTKDILLLADYPEPGGNFPADSDMVAFQTPQTYIQKKIYLSNHPIGDARKLVMDGINQGALLVNFIGHAGLDRLAQDGLIVSDDVSSMKNGGNLPVLTAMTCMIGLFSFPGYDTLGEEMLLKENGGVIAVFAPSSLSINSEAAVLDREIFNAFFLNRQKQTLGDIILNALKRAKTSGISGSLLEQYILLGDPALLVK